MRNIKLLILSLSLFSTYSFAEEKELDSKAQASTSVTSEESDEQYIKLERPFKRDISMIETVPFNNQSLEFGLEYPTHFGIHLKYLLNSKVYARLGAGLMHTFFLSPFEQMAPSFGFINEDEVLVISETLKDSVHVDFRLAWIPYLGESGGGPYLEAGISHTRYGGKIGLKGSQLNKVIPGEKFDELKDYAPTTNTTRGTFHVGYQVPLEKINLNIEVGVAKIFTVSILPYSSEVTSKTLNKDQEEEFKNFLLKKGWIFPTISAWLSFPF